MNENENIGRTIGRYRLLEEIGRGGMAIVYRALDTTLEREVALKLLHPYLTSHNESLTRFKREAQAVARLRHDAVLEIYDYSAETQDDVFIVMELVQGTTLRRLIQDRQGEAIPAEAAALIMRSVCAALAHAHENGVVHRDVKPENILIGPDGEIKLSDFGIAHLAGMSQMTVTGQILGSPAYMSPEHVEMAELDARADIFSVGIILYELAVGRQPFEGQNPHAVLKQIVEGQYADSRSVNPGIGHHLANVVEKCLQHNRGERFESAARLMDALDEVLASTGFDTPKEMLRAFFEDPVAWAEAHKPRIIQRTLKLGLSARRKKRRREATDHFNRVLALEPGNEKAVEAVAGMNRRKRFRMLFERAALLVAAVIAFSAVGWGLSRSATFDETDLTGKMATAGTPAQKNAARPETRKPAGDMPPEPPEPEAPKDTEEVETVEPAAAPAKVQPPSQKLNKTWKSKKRPRTPDEPPPLREVVFTPHPLAVEIVIDGKTRFQFGPANRSHQIPVGEHTISFIPKDTTRFLKMSWTVNIPEGETPFQFRKRLQWRDATVRVNSNVDASVTIPGRVAGRANREFSVAMQDGPSEKLSVLVSRDGYDPKTKKVVLNAGELTTLSVNLTKKSRSSHP